jgi:hypothetical protein
VAVGKATSETIIANNRNKANAVAVLLLTNCIFFFLSFNLVRTSSKEAALPNGTKRHKTHINVT